MTVEDIVYANNIIVEDVDIKLGASGVFNIIKDPTLVGSFFAKFCSTSA